MTLAIPFWENKKQSWFEKRLNGPSHQRCFEWIETTNYQKDKFLFGTISFHIVFGHLNLAKAPNGGCVRFTTTYGKFEKIVSRFQRIPKPLSCANGNHSQSLKWVMFFPAESQADYGLARFSVMRPYRQGLGMPEADAII